jgi:putative lipoic acid-binding regulatory protein
MEKQLVEYPCAWSFRIIGKDRESMQRAVAVYMKETEYLLRTSNTSRSGKYVSLNLETVVLNEDVRNQIYADLKNLFCIKLVL